MLLSFRALYLLPRENIMKVVTILVALPPLILTACADMSTPTTESELSTKTQASAGGQIGTERYSCYDPEDPHCINEPPPEDPCPDCPGVYLGEQINPSSCTDSTIGDPDQDGLDSWCEYQIARSFRPLLSTNYYDKDLSREPYWAVRLGEHSNWVTVIYLFGYHQDNGNDFGCPQTSPGYCDGHFGDSEFIVMTIAYGNINDHWALEQAFLSAHWNTSVNSSEHVLHDELSYPSNRRWYPRIYVARDKHANYKSKDACNAGALWTDTCVNNLDDVRFAINRYRNVGSRNGQLIDRVGTTTGDLNRPEFAGELVT